MECAFALAVELHSNSPSAMAIEKMATLTGFEPVLLP